MNRVVPTAPAGTNDNRAASTAFVQNALSGGLPLSSGQIYIGSIANLATAQTISGAGDCSSSLAVNGVLTFTCTKTNGAAFSALATTTPGTSVATALGVNVGSAGAFVVNGGVLGTPSSGVGTNLTALNGSNISSGTVANARLTGSGITTVAGQSCALGATCGLSALANSIASNVALNNTATYFDGPTVAQGTTGVWYASGSVTLTASTADTIICRLNDGTTTVATGAYNIVAGANVVFALSGVVSTPAGNIRISCRDASSVNGNIVATADTIVKASTISAIRIQ